MAEILFGGWQPDFWDFQKPQASAPGVVNSDEVAAMARQQTRTRTASPSSAALRRQLDEPQQHITGLAAENASPTRQSLTLNESEPN